MYEVSHYKTRAGRDVFLSWLDQMRDRRARAAVESRVNRLVEGNFGDHKFCRDGVWELRIDVGAGYRLYYSKLDTRVVVLLCGGDKRSQISDIERAVQYWKQVQEEMK